MNNIDYSLRNKAFADVSASKELPSEPTLPKGGGGGTYGGMGNGTDIDTRIKAVESAVDSVRHSQNVTLGVLGLAVTVGIFGLGYLLNRVDQVSDNVAALPSQISSDLQELTRTISGSITATRSALQQPQVIVIPEASLVRSDGSSGIIRPVDPNSLEQFIQPKN